jgi:hypothetical protein
VRDAHSELSQLARKIKEYDYRLTLILTPEMVFDRLIASLPVDIVIIGHALQVQGTGIEESLKRLKETKKSLGHGLKEKAHFSKHKPH